MINVLSLFDGMSCGQLALQKLKIPVSNYFASEIDKYAIEVARKNFPGTKHIGCVIDINVLKLPIIDLLIGGSPCQGFSVNGKRLNFDDPRSALFFEYVRILKEIRKKNPAVLFLLENVKMDKESLKVITDCLSVEPVLINSSNFSAQSRERYYWTNIHIVEPLPKSKQVFSDIIANDYTPDNFLKKCYTSNLFCVPK